MPGMCSKAGQRQGAKRGGYWWNLRQTSGSSEVTMRGGEVKEMVELYCAGELGLGRANGGDLACK